MEIKNDLKELARARAFVREFCQGPGIPLLDEDNLSQLELAVNEAVSNIMKHAYQGRSDQRIEIAVEAKAKKIIVRLYHQGKAFDPNSVVRPPAFDGSQENGFGLYLIEQCVDQVSYIRDEGGRNCVCLAKNRPKSY